jgi:hypothetical protein
VSAVILAAQNSFGVLSLILLNQAATRSRQRGLTDLAYSALAKMQSINLENLGMASFQMNQQLAAAEWTGRVPASV